MTRRVVIERYEVGDYCGLRVVDRDGDRVTAVITGDDDNLVRAAQKWRALNGIAAPVTRLVQVVKP